MTITAEQLDELERRSNDFNSDGPPSRWVPVECWMALQLVAIARAALAWSEARYEHVDACGQIVDDGNVTRAAYQSVIEALYKLMRSTP